MRVFVRVEFMSKHSVGFAVAATGVCLLVLGLVAGCQPMRLGPPAEIVTSMDGSEMVYVRPGVFKRGSDDGPDPERPQKTITLRGFYIDKFEVTNAQYRRFVEATGRPEPVGSGIMGNRRVADFEPWGDKRFNGPSQPVVCVSWEDAAAYAAWAGKRLPTEAEWEKAARGTDGRAYAWGSEWDPDRCQCALARHGLPATAPVGSLPSGASPYGCLDMTGNVWEWTASLYRPYPYRADDGREDPERNEPRVMRGGGWSNDEEATLQVAHRGRNNPIGRGAWLGFRCAVSMG